MSTSKPIALITGGAGGMGVAIARVLAPDYQLLLADLHADRLASTVALLGEDDIVAQTQVLDVADADSIAALVARMRDMGPLGAVAHTAGVSPTMASGEVIMKVNLKGSTLLMDALRPLVTTGTAAVLIASQAAHFARATATPELTRVLADPLAADLEDQINAIDSNLLSDSGFAYGVSKYGVMLLALREAAAWGPLGGRVVSLCPGIIDTGMARQEMEASEHMQMIVDNSPAKRLGLPAEIANTVRFLVSDDTSFITATDILVDGGSTQFLLQMITQGAS
jgi:NAD(P)-dependent dehydrogenase (short-subunit alcohol dehydrogenase family)